MQPRGASSKARSGPVRSPSSRVLAKCDATGKDSPTGTTFDRLMRELRREMGPTMERGKRYRHLAARGRSAAT